MTKKHTIATAGAAAFAAIALAVAAPLTANAHVRVDPDQATPGSYTVLTFRVPTESATAGTVSLEVDLPTKTPFTSVSYQPVPGWSAVVTTSTLPKPVKIAGATVTKAPTKIVWTADPGVRVEPGQFQEFSISAGVVPKTGKVELPATQTYSDGSVVKWDDPTPASGAEPEHPAPTLYIEDAPPAEDSPSIVSSTPAPAASSDSSAEAAAIGVSIGALALAAVALILAVLALTASRRPAPRGAASPENGPTRGGGTPA